MNQLFETIPCSSGELPGPGQHLTDKGYLTLTTHGSWIPHEPSVWLKPIPAPEPIPEGEGVTCQKCGNRYRVDLMVPDALWNQIKPEGKENGAGLLCGHCIISAMEAQGYGHLNCQGEAPTSINIQELIPIRDYFGENDKTPFQHRAFSVLDKIINKRAPTRMTLQDAKDEVARKCNDYIKRYDNWETMENALATELPRVLLRRLEKAAELYASGSFPVQGEAMSWEDAKNRVAQNEPERFKSWAILEEHYDYIVSDYVDIIDKAAELYMETNRDAYGRDRWNAACEAQMNEVYAAILPGHNTNAESIKHWTKTPDFQP